MAWLNERASYAGGCEKYIFEVARSLRERGCRSTLLYQPAHDFDRRFSEVFDAALPLVAADAQLACSRPDIVFVHRWDDCSTLKTLRDLKVPAVKFFHDHQLFCPREHKYTAVRRRTCTRTVGLRCYGCLGGLRRDTNGQFRMRTPGSVRREQRHNRFFDAYVVGSRYMADHAAAHGFPPERLHVINLFAEKADSPASLEPVAREPDLVLFVGQLLMGKGLDVLIEAVARARTRPRLAIAGSGRQEHRFRTLARRWHVADRVSFLGRLGTAQLDLLYRGATCVAVPSRTPETFGLVGVEALNHGTPVIASSVGGVHEWLEHERTGLVVEPGDPGALAAAIDRLVENPGLARSLGDVGRARCKQRFRLHQHVDELITLFRSLTRVTHNH